MPQPTNSIRQPGKRDPSYIKTLAILGAFALFLSTIEFMIPKPLPYLRIGLANLPILVSLYILPVPQIFLLVLIKVLGQGLVNGTLFSYIFLLSLFGSFSSGMVMVLVSRSWIAGDRRERISFIGISVTGALASNSTQIILSSLFIFGKGAWYIAPPFLAIGLITSCILGYFTHRFANSSTWYRTKLEEHHR